MIEIITDDFATTRLDMTPEERRAFISACEQQKQLLLERIARGEMPLIETESVVG